MSNKLNEVTIYLAKNISYGALNKLIVKFAEKKRRISYVKHFGVGSVIKRRDKKKEEIYGACTKALSFLTTIKNIKKNADMYEVRDCKVNALDLVTQKLGDNYKRYWNIR